MVDIRERVKTGIDGFDELINGGIPRGNLVVITGSCGTGKTTFGIQFLYKGATEYNEPGVYVSMEETPERIIAEMELYGWDIRGAIRDKKLLIVKTELYKFDALIQTIEDAVDSINAKRIVIDPLSVLSFYSEKELEIRRNIMKLSNLVKKMNLTAIVISEVPEGTEKLSFFGVEEFVADGVVALYYRESGNIFVRYLAIKKMRGTAHSNKLHPMEITSTGIKVFPSEEVFLSF